MVLFCFWILVPCLCQQDDLDNNATTTAVYVVTLRQAPASHNLGELKSVDNGFTHDAASGRTQFHKPRYGNITKTDKRYGSYVARHHDSLLKKVLKGEKYLKHYSYHYLINGFAVLVTQQQLAQMKTNSINEFMRTML